MKRFRFCSHFVLTATLLVVPSAAILQVTPLHAQQAAFRSVTGEVVDKGGNKVKGAVVHMKDTRSLSQRSYITAEDGAFRFNQLSQNTDYEVWADLDGKKSPSKSIGSFDTKKVVDVSLKMPD